MSTVQTLALLLALSVASHIGSTAAYVVWRGGTRPATAILIGASATGTACGLYVAAVSAYR
ncbi:hypothetical protein ACFWA4_16150 [Streptomyces sp. NPDC060011]|uniref:hypothetical protein n=1 Tax=Streptomyces sp. NPDC060011 TaxID=3347037 RepID=UPI0036A3D63D